MTSNTTFHNLCLKNSKPMVALILKSIKYLRHQKGCEYKVTMMFLALLKKMFNSTFHCLQ